MATVHNSKEEAIEMLEEWLKEPITLKVFINNLKSRSYNNSDVEFILEAFDCNTNHVIKEK